MRERKHIIQRKATRGALAREVHPMLRMAAAGCPGGVLKYHYGLPQGQLADP